MSGLRRDTEETLQITGQFLQSRRNQVSKGMKWLLSSLAQIIIPLFLCETCYRYLFHLSSPFFSVGFAVLGDVFYEYSMVITGHP